MGSSLLGLWLVCSLFLVHTALGGGFDPKFSHAPHYTQSKLYQTSIGFEAISGTISCYGDFNNDKYTDIFVTSANRSDVKLYLWNTKTYKFEPINVLVHFDFEQVASASALDLNRDGKLDLLVQTHPFNMATHPPILNTSVTIIRAYFGDHSTFTDELLLPEAYGGQVAIMEANGDLLPDLLGNRPNSAGQLEKTLWINDNKGMAWKLEAFPGSSTPLKDPHSVASVDFDGDCMPDLFLDHADGSSQLWILDPSSGKFHFRMNVAAAGEVQGRGQVTFGDFDADGAVDMLFPICYPASDCSITNEIRIFYNVQKPVCSGLFSKNCRKSTALCTADDSFSFSPFTTATPNDNVVIVQVGPQVSGRLFAPMGDSSVPLTLRAGDYNIDRFLDLLVPVLPTATNISQVTLWKNVPCTDTLCGSQATKSKRRTFVPVLGDSVSALSGIIGGTGGSWLDLDEDGSLDIMVSSETTNSISQKVTSMTAVTNNFFNDGYFVKTLGLNGLCTVNCGIKEIQLGNKPYGVNQHGAAWKYTLADLSGTQLVNAVPQLPQSAYSALQTPYVLSGLGRPSNYIDYVYMGVSVYGTGKGHWQSWPGIIPNSQVVVTPYPLNNPTNWAIELYISPSGALLWIALAVAACLIISGAGIVFFQWREKKADEAEKKEREHLFSFNAM